MHQTTTLRGVFPEPKTPYRRNFIKENVKSIKQMQGLLQEAGVIQPRAPREDKYRSQPKILSRDSTPIRQAASQEKFCTRRQKKPVALAMVGPKIKLDKKKENEKPPLYLDDKFTHRSVQTERTDDVNKLYETGVIKYPSPSLMKPKIREGSPQKNGVGQGDSVLETELQNLDLDEKDFIKENMNSLKPRVVKQQALKVPAQAPATYQRGVVPKYLKDRKEEDQKGEAEEPCPQGHVLLPEEERKETLRVLRQSYADRIQELNSLPVRSDTLRIKKRKMEIEEELKRIDGGIKVFQRPKVYVKINA